MKNTAAAGRVSAKTGTIGHVNSLSGYATTVRGAQLLFSILGNNNDLHHAGCEPGPRCHCYSDGRRARSRRAHEENKIEEAEGVKDAKEVKEPEKPNAVS